MNYRRDIDIHIEYVRGHRRHCAEQIRPDAERFLDQLLAVQANKKAKDKPATPTSQAVDNVNRYANQGCGVFERQGGI